ncbi:MULTISPECIES: adenosylcobinamide-GDP ribazoletransferase [unclassified Colwellia]|uniref:adenosylcobinamide-GDP ribazoletransferase n=1 Tax=unclassified Colwellia TaxID=196834 RepID=UPI0015F61D0E|nr:MULTISPECIES: adenosylcobinamide-GDP ribazoletransferase [unclassified Colwellia]MBA6230688.1 adenosylcobinamide-GDP ribazoletransferase [Colwellia sp. MB02u-7]MBA6234619.1 adenosylcobinamide-GDP ribazoletransferase [Colwellia sp. MB02u-11]MBA6255483.1 adenosylcobinamide-GDP ribazoletransferase [Colwellia sp. MB3u-28]MBA6261623.1 adenosylcobinamide-GDP ribazoletransferase [Colwellia sp. MB3u-41]MBA6301173.1 adenosylcobinamide-GDP ribazoletransferase [Colwellia sp. MB3u-22]
MTKQSLGQQCQQQYYLLLLALSFFTRVPVRLPEVVKPEMLHQASRYFALIGVFIGAVTALILVLLASFLPLSLAVLISMACSLLLTGAFHEDGWADVWDGFGGGWTVEQKLNIMKDSRLGTYGAASLFFILMTKYQSLVLLGTHNENPVLSLSFALVLAHTLSRTVSTSLIFSMSYVSEDAQSKVKPLAQHLSIKGLTILLITGAVVLFTFLPLLHAFVMIVCLWIIRILLILWFNRQLGGFTGDCLGAAQQILEVAVYIILLVLVLPSTVFLAEVR